MKQGSVEIFTLSIFIILMFIFLSIMFLLYVQINSCIFSVKNDVFYIVQNGYFSLDEEELVYSNYIVDQSKLTIIVEKLLRLNYPNYIFVINKVEYDTITKSINIDINLKLTPFILKDILGIIDIKIKDNIKLKVMEVR